MAKHRNGETREAQEYFNKALDIALPDRVLLPFAQRMSELHQLLSGGSLSREELSALKTLGARQEQGVNAIRRAVFQTKSNLTPREREVAELARERLSVREIALKLFISEATVKTILKSVYSKLEIHSKAELNLRKF
ncbi:hypothetical protein SDC9_98780 [bioreactor metagenome]|uniref:HTH luxR-type domain-containing protein n=1 Tax=bioreactor metagenome TaxID=1076179 RepID=A0A645AG87_9ZZZZ